MNNNYFDLPKEFQTIYNDKVQLPMTADKDFIINIQDVDLVVKI